MRKITLESVKDCYVIYQNGEYVVFLGGVLWIFRVDGTFVAKKQNIRWPHMVAFLPDDRAVVRGSKNYHYISLADGADLWECPIPKRSRGTQLRLAVSPDGKEVYDSYYGKDERFYVIRIIPEEHQYTSYFVPQGYRVSDHLFCDAEGVLCSLESQGFQKGVYQMGIRKVILSSEVKDVVWRRLWTQSAQPRTLYTDGKYVLCSDLTVLKLETMERISLFEDRGDWNPLGGISYWTYDTERSLMTVCDVHEHENLVIDCRKRRMIARYSGYFGDTVEEKRVGCLVGDEFWIGTPNGVVRKSFPVIEELPEYKPIDLDWVFTKQVLAHSQKEGADLSDEVVTTANNILKEETEAYFNGSKSFEEMKETIKSRTNFSVKSHTDFDEMMEVNKMHGEELLTLSDYELFEKIYFQACDALEAIDHGGKALNQLSDACKTAYVLLLYDAEMQNGGLCQFFVNSTEEIASLVSECLEILGADDHRKLYDDFVAANNIDLSDSGLFQIGTIDEYLEQVERFDYDSFDKSYYKLPSLEQSVIEFVRANINEF